MDKLKEDVLYDIKYKGSDYTMTKQQIVNRIREDIISYIDNNIPYSVEEITEKDLRESMQHIKNWMEIYNIKDDDKLIESPHEFELEIISENKKLTEKEHEMKEFKYRIEKDIQANKEFMNDFESIYPNLARFMRNSGLAIMDWDEFETAQKGKSIHDFVVAMNKALLHFRGDGFYGYELDAMKQLYELIECGIFSYVVLEMYRDNHIAGGYYNIDDDKVLFDEMYRNRPVKNFMSLLKSKENLKYNEVPLEEKNENKIKKEVNIMEKITWHGLSEEDIVKKNMYGSLDAKCLEAADSYEQLAEMLENNPDDNMLRRIRTRMKVTGLEFKDIRDQELNIKFEEFKEVFPQFTLDKVELSKETAMDKFMSKWAVELDTVKDWKNLFSALVPESVIKDYMADPESIGKIGNYQIKGSFEFCNENGELSRILMGVNKKAPVPYATWIQDYSGGYLMGHYFNSEESAKSDMIKRSCKEIGVDLIDEYRKENTYNDVTTALENSYYIEFAEYMMENENFMKLASERYEKMDHSDENEVLVSIVEEIIENMEPRDFNNMEMYIALNETKREKKGYKKSLAEGNISDIDRKSKIMSTLNK